MEILLKLIRESLSSTFIIWLLIFYVAYLYLSKPKNMPPGPRGLPILGYLPYLGKVPYETFTKLGEKYGSVYSVYLGNRLAIVLTDFQAANEAFVKQGDTFSGRPKELRYTFPVDNYKNLVITDGDFWRDHRRFALSIMRECGMGKISIELKITEEIDYYLQEIKATQEKCFNIRSILSTSVANNINAVVLGRRFDYKDPEFLTLNRKIDEFNKLSGVVTVLVFLPFLRFVPGVRYLLKYGRMRQLITDIDNFIKVIVGDHKGNYSDGQKDDYIHAYITEKQERDKKSNQDETFSDDALVSNARMLEAAGIETTTTTLLWGIIFMMRHPEVQKKVQEEIDKVIGHDRTPSWSDRLRTPYTEATICEIQRKSNLVPINVPHRNIEECELLGYKIPADSYVLLLIGNIMNDPKLWGDPQNFRPERFLNDKGEVERPPYFIPFSTGKRQCLGETLAKMELYLYFTSMLQKYTFMKPTAELPSLEGHIGLTHVPKCTLTRAMVRTNSYA